jgi:hypothetical protein
VRNHCVGNTRAHMLHSLLRTPGVVLTHVCASVQMRKLEAVLSWHLQQGALQDASVLQLLLMQAAADGNAATLGLLLPLFEQHGWLVSGTCALMPSSRVCPLIRRCARWPGFAGALWAHLCPALCAAWPGWSGSHPQDRLLPQPAGTHSQQGRAPHSRHRGARRRRLHQRHSCGRRPGRCRGCLGVQCCRGGCGGGCVSARACTAAIPPRLRFRWCGRQRAGPGPRAVRHPPARQVCAGWGTPHRCNNMKLHVCVGGCTG